MEMREGSDNASGESNAQVFKVHWPPAGKKKTLLYHLIEESYDRSRLTSSPATEGSTMILDSW